MYFSVYFLSPSPGPGLWSQRREQNSLGGGLRDDVEGLRWPWSRSAAPVLAEGHVRRPEASEISSGRSITWALKTQTDSSTNTWTESPRVSPALR